MQDADQAGIALVDLGSARQHPQSCSWAPVDEDHFERHPGLAVLQMAWHPGDTLSLESTTCLSLTSDAFSSRVMTVFPEMAPCPSCTRTAGGRCYSSISIFCRPAVSSGHLAVLLSDQSWQLYNVADLSMPEQRFKLQWRSSR